MNERARHCLLFVASSWSCYSIRSPLHCNISNDSISISQFTKCFSPSLTHSHTHTDIPHYITRNRTSLVPYELSSHFTVNASVLCACVKLNFQTPLTTNELERHKCIASSFMWLQFSTHESKNHWKYNRPVCICSQPTYFAYTFDVPPIHRSTYKTQVLNHLAAF